MNNSTFLLNAINEFDFLKQEAISIKSGCALDVPSVGFLIAVNTTLAKNKTMFAELMGFDDRIKSSIEKQNEICFLAVNCSYESIGYFCCKVEDESEFTLIIKNHYIKKPYQQNFENYLDTLIKWYKQTLFVECVFIEPEENSLYNPYNNDFEQIGFNRTKASKETIFREGKNKNIGNELILTAGPSIGSREKAFALDAASYGWNNQWSKYLKEFEKEFANYVGVKHAMATSSCTGALHIAMMALGISPGDEVIVPDITWVATANAVMLAGGTPVFADIDFKTWKIDPKSIESLINNNTKAIIPVHLYGNPCNMDEIIDIAKKHNLFIVEDAAPSIGATYKGKRTGSFGDFSAFSFQGAKLAVTGEGGMLCTDDDELYKKAFRIWDQGRIPGTFWIEELGVKYKMSNIQAALGLGQLHRNDAMVEAKRRINLWYYEFLNGLDCIDFWKEDVDSRSIYWMTNIRLNEKAKISREVFCDLLKEKNIDTRPVFPAISQYPYWPKKQVAQPISKIVGETAINLPSGVGLTKEHIEYISSSIIKILK